jgi:hypothetical protein
MATEPSHEYNAQASIISGTLELPLHHQIVDPSAITLPPSGGYVSMPSPAFKIGEVISYRSGYTQVAGNRDLKPGHGFSTLVTVVVEGLNVLDVLTADRVVGQIITEYPLVGSVPKISFLGTRFQNLSIGGHPVKPVLGFGILGGKPANDGTYTLDAGVQSRISAQNKSILADPNLPDDLRERYTKLQAKVGQPEELEASLVDHMDGEHGHPGFGHVIHIPDFGKVTLGKLTLKHENFDTETHAPKKTTVNLTMIDLELGCAVSGHIPIGTGSSNGGPG